VAALFTKFDPRAFLDGERNASAAAAGEEPTLATLSGLAGPKTHSEKPDKQAVRSSGVPGKNVSAESATANPAKLAKVRQLEPLRRGADCWSDDDWRARFDQRAAVAEHDSGLSRAEAERLAFECCVVEWLNVNPSPSPPGRCTWCGKPEMASAVVLPFGTEPGTHAWLHAECWPAWHQVRRADAIAALSSIGLRI
jgi:hypothetical protein